MSFVAVDSGKAEATILAKDESQRRTSSIPRLQDGIALGSGFTRSILKGFLQGDQLPVLRAALVNISRDVSELMVHCNWKERITVWGLYIYTYICCVGADDYECNVFVAVAGCCSLLL